VDQRVVLAICCYFDSSCGVTVRALLQQRHNQMRTVAEILASLTEQTHKRVYPERKSDRSLERRKPDLKATVGTHKGKTCEQSVL
jgi:hypothetical protein